MNLSTSWLAALVSRQVVVNHWIVATLLGFDDTTLHLDAEGGPLAVPRDRVRTLSRGPERPPVPGEPPSAR